MKRLSIGLTMLALSGGTALAETLVPLSPGFYEVSTTMTPGDRSASTDRCVTAEHLVDPEGVFMYVFSKKYTPIRGTKVINYSVQGGKISYDVDTSLATVHVEGTVSDTEFSVVRDAKSKSGRGIPMQMKLVGKRTRDCKKGD
jgi:hypothetical protein